ncbi:hypothetical protein FA95DRAFT_279701 [Auriscalpium vulgare]|uniref:Uncharacterized protein n=1 Tax=Auriscalpium vulgare TaxID=40419 RepID=A0ACB8S596_9AGAM|nr:hypothetical protein FA95DRAFT_279701 [Auriscalpium vulgare]
MQEVYDTVVLGKKDDATLQSGNAWVDVRDLGLAHVLAAEQAAADGKRIIISGGSFFWQEIVDVANSIKPAPVPNLAKGKPGSTIGKPYLYKFKSSSERILGLEYRSLESTLRNALENFEELKELKDSN